MSYYNLDRTDIGQSLGAELIVMMPIYNERENIGNVIAEWRTALRDLQISFQFLLIDDGSTDGTLEELLRLENDDAGTLFVVHKLNSGHGTTCRLGYEIAGASTATWILQIDSDGQCDPQYFAEMWKLRNGFDCVFGKRHSRDDGLARVITSAICRMASSALSGVHLQDPNVPYRLLKRLVLLEALKKIPRSFNIHNVALTYVLAMNREIRFSYVPIHFRDRQGGSNSINILRVTQWGFEMVLELMRIKV